MNTSKKENKPRAAFAQQLFDSLDNDCEIVDADSKYTAFWLAHGLPLSSQYRQARCYALYLSSADRDLPCLD